MLSPRELAARILLDPIIRWAGRLELGEHICLDCRDGQCSACYGCDHDCPPGSSERRFRG